MTEEIDVYVSIGNSDDKLTQMHWAEFVETTEAAIQRHAPTWHGKWFSSPASGYQNACFGFSIAAVHCVALRAQLARQAARFCQDSIAWSATKTEFIAADTP